jgi:predicted membrane-bound spermidine synthase
MVEAASRTDDAARSQRLLGPLVFVGGLSSIGIELTASRLLAPYFGSSTFIWANLIGLTLTYLSIGYYLGGRIADRYPDARVLYAVTGCAAFTTGLVPLVARPILSASLDAFDRVAVGAFYGSLLGTILLFAAPITLLGFVTPYAIRLRLQSVAGAGQTAGRIYALSTVGSIAGSFLPVVVLVPLIGTARTFLTLSLVLLVLSIAGLIEVRARTLAILAAALIPLLIGAQALASGHPIKPPYRGHLVEEAESEYNYIQVLKEGDRYLLALNEGHAVHSIYDPASVLTGGPWDYFMIAPLFARDPQEQPVSRTLMIGLAGGTAARSLVAAYPDIVIDGVEIDPEVVRLGRKYFALSQPNVRVTVDDGRYFVRRTTERYDLIGVDAYRQPYIPFHLTTKEFFEELAAHLTAQGVVVVNVGRTATDYRLVEVIASTMRAVFPSVHVVDVAGYNNSMVIGSYGDLNPPIQERIEQIPIGSPLRSVAELALQTGNIRVVEPGGQVFTDDHAPVEWVVDQMIFDAAREGENP